MAIIKSGAGTDQWTIDPLSKAGRVTLYDVAGNALSTLPVSGTVNANVINFPVTQPVSVLALPLPLGASTEATLALIKAKTDNLDVLLSTRTKPGDTQPVSLATAGVPLDTQEFAAALCVTATGASGAAVTLTLPAVVASFHFITLLEITKYSVAAITGTATPVLVTSTNLPGNPIWTFETAGAIGTQVSKVFVPAKSLRSSVVNTATTIVCPATTSTIWRINVWYLAD